MSYDLLSGKTTARDWSCGIAIMRPHQPPKPSPAPTSKTEEHAAAVAQASDPTFLKHLDEEANELHIKDAGIARRYLAKADAILDKAREKLPDVDSLPTTPSELAWKVILATSPLTIALALRETGARKAARELVDSASTYVDRLKRELTKEPDTAILDIKTRRHIVLALRHAGRTFKTIDEVSKNKYNFFEEFVKSLKEVFRKAVVYVAKTAASIIKPIADAGSGILWPVAITAAAIAGSFIVFKAMPSRGAS